MRTCQVLQIEIACGIDPTQFVGESQKWRFRMPPVVFRLLFRTTFLGSQILLAQMLLSGEGDTILALQSLAGAVGMSGERTHWILKRIEYTLVSECVHAEFLCAASMDGPCLFILCLWNNSRHICSRHRIRILSPTNYVY